MAPPSPWSPLPDLVLARQGGRVSGPAFASLLSRRRVASLALSGLRGVDAARHSAPINDLSLDPSDHGRFLLAGATDGSLYVHDLARPRDAAGPRFTANVAAHIGRSNKHSHNGNVDSVQWFPADSALFVSAGADRTVKFWDANALVPADTYSMGGRVHCVHMSAIASHQLAAAATAVNHVRLIDPKSGSDAHELRGHESGAVVVCRWSNRRENLLATGGADGKVILWDIRRSKSFLAVLDYDNVRTKSRKRKAPSSNEKKAVSHKGGVCGVCFSHDGLSIFTLGRDAVLRKWCANTGRNLKAKFPMIFVRKRTRVPFEVAEGLVCVPSEDSKLYLLDANSYEKTRELVGHYDGVNCCVYNPCGNELLSGGMDRNILIWDADAEATEQYDRHVREGGQERESNALETHNVIPLNQDTWSDSEEE